MQDLLQNLNEKQKEAVLATEGPLLIIAGAGSGKTTALTRRIAYIIQEKGVSPTSILAVTFTNKAAKEMQDRLESLIPEQLVVKPTMGTFHSVCVRILRREIHQLGMENSFTIYDSADQIALMKTIFKERHIDEKQYNPKAVLGSIGKAKNDLVPPEKYTRYVVSPFHEMVNEIYPLYQKALTKAQALDFDDLIMKTVELFVTFPHVLERYQSQYHYICVDEYQDTNNAQYKLVHMLADKHKNICVIGDDWQSIYSWRGANMNNILSFEEDYPEAKVIKLEQNYRSTDTIVKAANAVIHHNQERTDKELWTERTGEEKIAVLETYDERHESERIVGLISQLVRETDQSYRDMALLYRTNAQSRVLEEAMMRHGIPYRIVGGVKFYERKEIKDVLAYLKLILNPRDTVSLLRIVNVPARKVGAKTIEVLQQYSVNLGISLFEVIQNIEEVEELSTGAQTALKNFRELVRELRMANTDFPAAGVIKHVLKLAGYEKYLLDGTDEGEERFHNVEELMSVASKYDALEPGISLATFLEEVALVSDIDQVDTQENAVTLMTLHSSKGLEFSNVFIVGLEEGIFPSGRSHMDPKSLEEERRLMYVGMTRARDRLYLSFAKSRMLYGRYQDNINSRFIQEIPEEFLELEGSLKRSERLVESAFSDEPQYVSLDDSYEEVHFEVGDTVRHASWGEGKVIEAQGDVLTICFKNPRFGTKKVAANIAPLQKIF